jgi:hypothetical protein
MRTQNCREKIHKTAEKCGLSPETVAEIDRVSGFANDKPQICGLTTDAIKPLMKISDPEKQKEAISLVEKSLNRKTPTGGVIKKRITKPEVEKIVKKVDPTAIPEKQPVLKAIENPATAPKFKSFLEDDPAPAKEESIKAYTLADKVAGIPAPIVTAPQPLEKPKDINYYADGLFDKFGEVTKKEVMQLMKDNPTWKKKADVFYFGVQALVDVKKKK